jgi:cytochrome P450
MNDSPVGTLRRMLPPRAVTYAMLRGAFSRHQLPPGNLADLEALEKSDRYYLLHQSAEVGPIFKAKGPEHFWVCITGLSRCRRFLQEHSKSLQGYMHDLEPLVPNGALRRMEGEVHRKYRRALISGIRVDELFREDAMLYDIVAKGLETFAATQDDGADPTAGYRMALNSIATASLLKVFFGAEPGTPLFEALIRGYQKLGPFGLVWNIGKPQEIAFGEIRDALRDFMASEECNASGAFANSIAGKLSVDNLLDDTLLGNLIYMIEMGRYDQSGLLRWLSKYAAAEPELLARLSGESKTEADGEHSFAKAFVMETLRTDKSERLTRVAQRDIVFDGYLIPRNTFVRLCLWEAHHSAEIFKRPFEFNPDRFLQTTYGGDKYSPFGLDHHLCPIGDISMRLAIIFLRQLSADYHLETLGDGLPIRGAYHWEPAVDFGVRLSKNRAESRA